MNDAPDFPFFPQQWIIATRTLSRDERGDYIDLLCYQWDLDGLPINLTEFARILGYKSASKLSAALMAKFPISADGKRRNPRLEIEREKQRSRIEKSRDRIGKMNQARASYRTSPRDSTRSEQEPLQDGASTPSPVEPPLPHTHAHTQEKKKNSPIVKRPPPKEPIPAESQEACERYAMEIGAHWRDGKAFWHRMEEANWFKGGGKIPILDWRATMRTWESSGWLPSRQKGTDFDWDEAPPWAAKRAEGEPSVDPDCMTDFFKESWAKAQADKAERENPSTEYETVEG